MYWKLLRLYIKGLQGRIYWFYEFQLLFVAVYDGSKLNCVSQANSRRKRIYRIACWGNWESRGQCEPGRPELSKSPPRYLHHSFCDSFLAGQFISPQRTLNAKAHPAKSCPGNGSDGSHDTGTVICPENQWIHTKLIWVPSSLRTFCGFLLSFLSSVFLLSFHPSALPSTIQCVEYNFQFHYEVRKW